MSSLVAQTFSAASAQQFVQVYFNVSLKTNIQHPLSTFIWHDDIKVLQEMPSCKKLFDTPWSISIHPEYCNTA